MTERLRAAIYTRISRDAQGDDEDAGIKRQGVQRQEKDCRALAERLGWEVVQVYEDNDISAFSGKVRPQYRAMLAAAKAGQVRAILAWHPDRLYRRAVDLEEIVNIAEANHLQIATVTAGDVNLSTPAGRMNARIIAAVAQGEVENTRSRVRRKKEEMAASGKYRGGRRPFGYEKDGKTIRETEAEVIRQATTALRAGRSLRAVVSELNAQGSRTSTGKEWDPHTLRPVLLRARNAGLIQKGQVWHRDPDIVPGVKAEWPAIISEEEWRAVHKLLTDPSRLQRTVTSEPRWLGSGIYMCGKPTENGEVCGSIMRVSGVGETESRPNHRRTYHYKCAERNHLTANQEHVDKYVREYVAKMLRSPRFVEAMTANDGDAMQADRERRTLLVTRVQQTESDYDEGLIDGRRYKARLDKINTELSEVEERLAEGVQAATVSPIFNAPDPGAAFLAVAVPVPGKDKDGNKIEVPNPRLDIARAVLRATLRVVILPATAPRRVWKDDRIDITPNV